MKRLRGAPDLIRLRPRPRNTHISRGRSVLATTAEGLVHGDQDEGLFVHETRVLSKWRYLIDGTPPMANAFSCVQQNEWLGYFVCAAPGVEGMPRDEGSGQVPPESQNTLELQVARTIDGGLHEELTLTNFTLETTEFTFAIELDADFVDAAETSSIVSPWSDGLSARRGAGLRARHSRENGNEQLDVRWSEADQSLTFDYTATHGEATLHRSVQLQVSDAQASYVDERLEFRVRLEPKQSWHASIVIATPDSDAPDRTHFLEEATQFESPASPTLTADVLSTLEQARSDLAALRLFDLDRDTHAWTVAAGLPLYVALFGRDTLTTGFQAGILGPDMMTGALHVLAELQGTKVDDWRDEQPGKMLHEAHTGPLAMLGYNPRARSYGSITTSGLYAFILAELWHWTGDKELVRPLVEPALRALQWLERDGDIDGDGLYEYRSRSPFGPKHQAWKDSPDAIVDADGRLVEPPIATCEEHAFVYAAKLFFSEVMWWLGEHELSKKIYREASELKKRFNEAFWMEEEGFYALGLDAKKQQIRSIASNAGHCIATAISDSALVPRTVERLFQPDLFSGWGIRTLSCDHPRYNPYSYHLGSIWPVEHGTFALGLWRYGLHERVEQLARAQFEAAALFEYHRLPELFGGHPRDEQHPFPGIYPNANPLQAWSSSSVFCLLQAMLGLYPYAPLHLLVVDPHLPQWLPEITLRGLRVGKARVTIRFHGTDYEILELEGKLHVVKQATPWSLTTQPAERVRDALASLVH